MNRIALDPVKGTIQIVPAPLVSKDRDPLIGTWNYADGVMTRGILRRQTLNLAVHVKSISLYDDVFRILVAERAATNAYNLTGALSGGSVIVGAFGHSRARRAVLAQMIFGAELDDGRFFTGVTTGAIFDHIRALPGVSEGAQRLDDK